ncbi:MAG TPA: polyphosphate kinase 2 family protein [Candidatus Baltobacteraceae bacterium]|nr:polyphosphate kinase 2 family protein [Candidatus Baltobacteraceae bacterium]
MAPALVGSALRDRLRVAPGDRVRLARHRPDETFGHVKADAGPVIQAGLDRLTTLQERIWAEGRHAVLIVLQGIDTAGKDGAIGHVMSAFNPQGCAVTGFKAPTPDELAHDYLWRVHRVVPARGTIGIFNRSHYEDVLVVRVHDLVPRAVWRQRYNEINAFEQLLADGGTTIIKFFLHISPDEQRRRLQARLDDPTKRWKFQRADLAERKLWPAYQAAYEDALSRCSTRAAPWYVIPADHKWFRDLAVAEIVGQTLADLKPRYPVAAPDLVGLRVE